MSTTDQIAAIEARRTTDGCAAHDECLISDAAYLLTLVREQAAKLAAVREVHKAARRGPVEPWAAGYKWTGHHCTHDGQSWPCETIAVLEARP